MQICAESILVCSHWDQQDIELTSSQPGGCSSPSLDLPVLLISQSAPAPLQRYHRQCDPPRVAPVQYHNRVQALSAGPKSSDFLVRGRYLPGGGELECSEGITCYELKSPTGELAGRFGDIWDYGMLHFGAECSLITDQDLLGASP
jgi:hypothetical protein